MIRWKIIFHSEMDAKRFEEVANNNIAPILEEQLGYTKCLCFEQVGRNVIMEYDVYATAIETYLVILDKKFNIAHCKPVYLYD